MLGCHIGRCFQVTVAGGSYQEGLTAVLQGVPPGMVLTEQEIPEKYPSAHGNAFLSVSPGSSE